MDANQKLESVPRKGRAEVNSFFIATVPPLDASSASAIAPDDVDPDDHLVLLSTLSKPLPTMAPTTPLNEPGNTADVEDISHAILLLPLPTYTHLLHPLHLSPAIDTPSRLPHLSRLLICLLSPLFKDASQGGLNVRENWQDVQRLLAITYVEAAREGQARGKMDMQVDVLVEPEMSKQVWERVEKRGKWDAVYVCEGLELKVPESSPLHSIPHLSLSSPSLPPNAPLVALPATSSSSSTHKISALGGTFDHLHSGHKILLSAASLLTSHKLIVGLTDPSLLKNKSHAELVESLDDRMRHVGDFVRFFKPELECELVSISDVAGPTAWDASIEALVVSRETMPGADAIAKIRKDANLPPLELYVIDVISHEDHNVPHEDAERLKKVKISSTFIREWLAKKNAEEEGKAPKEQEQQGN